MGYLSSPAVAICPPPPHSDRPLKGDPELKRRLQELCATDNWTNWLYIGRAWGVIALSIGGAVWFYYFAAASHLSSAWLLPVALVAIAFVGASQHQLAGGTHEATHHTLFTNRVLNELASDWLCAFPLFSSTYSFRLYHLMHHQFINDPQRDPDFMMLARSGHWLDFPVGAGRFLRMVFKQALILPLLRYVLVRFKYNAVGIEAAGAYKRNGKVSKLPERLAFAWVAGLGALLVCLTYFATPLWVVVLPPLYWLALAVVFALLPERVFPTARLKPVIPRRYLAMSRTFFVMTLFSGLTWAQMVSGQPVWWFFLVFWIIPALTAFPFFMILRQLVQHGNGDRGWLTNTRVFLVTPLLRYAVFPFGMDYHLPHHMYATVPHYRLPALHAFLLKFPEYAAEGQEVVNYILPSRSLPRRPTVVEVLGPEYAGRADEVYLDHTVLDDWDVDEKEEILRQATQAEGETGEPESASSDPTWRRRAK